MTFKEDFLVPVFIDKLAAQPHRFTGRAVTGFCDRVKVKRARRDHARRRFVFAGDRTPLRMVISLFGEFRIAFPELVIRNVPIDIDGDA